MTVNSESGKEDKIAPRIRCYFDINLGVLSVGRIVFELFTDVAPKSVENFRSLCTGERGLGITTGKNLHYKGCIFHRVVKDFMIQSGDFCNANGTGGESIYGGVFDDEEFEMKHDKPFLLSMANKGKNTNGSQFFITTQPAPHLDNVHIVFGCVVSGQDLVRQLEALPVDRNSRPLQDATISNCGELVRQVKVKKDKKKKRPVESNGEDNSDDSGNDEKKKKKDKKKKKEKKRDKSEEKLNSAVDEEDLEEGEVHPMVSITKIDPDDIPEVSNKFLMRKTPEKDVESKEKDKKDRPERRRDRERDRERDRPDARNNFGWPKKRNPLSRSGRAVKGRGVFRYRTPSKSRSRSRSYTPPHWKQAQKRTIKLSDFEKNEEDKRKRDAEIKRRETERKKRHEEMARDSKKSFYELQQTDYNASKGTDTVKEKDESEKEEGEIDGITEPVERGTRIRTKSGGSFDMNALDYEEHGSDREEKMRDDNKHTKIIEKVASSIEVSKKSDSMALAFGVEVKSIDLPSIDSINKDHIQSKDFEKQEDDNNFRRVARKQSRDQNIREHRSRSRDRRPYRNNNRQMEWRGRFRGGSRRRDFNRGRFERNRKSRSFDRSRRRSPIRRRSRDKSRRESRSRDRRRSTSNQRSRDISRTRSKSNLKKEISKSRSKSASEKREIRPIKQKSKEPIAVVPRITLSEEKARIQKEKMLKRAEAFLLFKSHMKKEIEEQEKKQQEKRLREERENNENALELIRLEKLKKDTLEKIQAHEEIIQLEAVKRVLETVVSSVKEKDLARKLKRSRRDTSPLNSDESDGKSKKKKKEKRKKSRRRSSSSSAY